MASKGFKDGTITLNEPRNIYYSGQVLKGLVEFDLETPLLFGVIKAVYIGQAIVKWTESQSEIYSGVKRVRNIEYSDREIYFSFEQVLCGGSGPTNLNAGHHQIEFSYQIPSNAPSSFNGSKGGISYNVAVIMEYLDSGRDELSTNFEIVAPLDLNRIEDLKRPTIFEFEETSGCNCFCQNDLIKLNISLPVSGYCPGQMMQITIESDNKSNVEISKIIFQFVRRERYYSNQRMSTYVPPEEVLDRFVHGPVLANTKRTFTCQMKVPDIIAYNLDNCKIIDIAYFFKVKVQFSGCANDVQDENELRIGLTPLRETVDETYIHPLSASLPNCLPLNASISPSQTQDVASVNKEPYEIGFKIPEVVNQTGKVPYQLNHGYRNWTRPSAPPL